MSTSTNGLMIAGVLLAIAGGAALAIPEFTTQQTDDVASIGSLKIQAKEDTSHSIPPLLSGGALALGIILVGGALYRRQ